MILTCPACQTRYQVDAAKFPPQGRSVRCARCGEVWHAIATESDAEFVAPEPPPPRPAPKPAPKPAPEPPREIYTQPAARDPEPQDRALTEGDSSARLGGFFSRLLRQRWFLLAGWAALAGVVLLIGFTATVYRREVVDAWPQSASLYAKLGMKVASNGLKIGNTKSSKQLHDGQIVLTVSGALTNVTDRELPVPQIRIGLVDSDKRELYHWIAAPTVMTLKPGQSTRFDTQLSNPPDEAVDYQVGFAKAGE